DLETPIANGRTLREVIGRGSILILDNEIDGPAGPMHPHLFLCAQQALRAAASGIDIAFLGRGTDLEHVLVPTEHAHSTTALERQERVAEDTAALVALAQHHERISV